MHFSVELHWQNDAQWLIGCNKPIGLYTRVYRPTDEYRIGRIGSQ